MTAGRRNSTSASAPMAKANANANAAGRQADAADAQAGKHASIKLAPPAQPSIQAVRLRFGPRLLAPCGLMLLLPSPLHDQSHPLQIATDTVKTNHARQYTRTVTVAGCRGRLVRGWAGTPSQPASLAQQSARAAGHYHSCLRSPCHCVGGGCCSTACTLPTYAASACREASTAARSSASCAARRSCLALIWACR